jgi:hypothetical protein
MGKADDTEATILPGAQAADWEQLKVELARLEREEPERHREITAELRQIRREFEVLHSEQYWLNAALTAPQLDTLEQARSSVANLFFLIEMKHGATVARSIFHEFGGAEKQDRKALFDQRLRVYYEHLNALTARYPDERQTVGAGISIRRFAGFLARNSAKAGWWFGFGRPGDTTSAEAIRKRLNLLFWRDK